MTRNSVPLSFWLASAFLVLAFVLPSVLAARVLLAPIYPAAPQLAALVVGVLALVIVGRRYRQRRSAPLIERPAADPRTVTLGRR